MLDRLIKDRRISSSEVNRYIGDLGREISELEQRLQSLRAASAGAGNPASAAPRRRGRPPGRPAASASGAAPQAATPATRRRRRRSAPVTAEVLASRKLQGIYLSLIRRVPASRRAQYSRIAKEKGREAAIRELRTVVK